MINKPITCSKCKRFFSEGITNYIVKIKIISDFDGIIPEYDEREFSKTYQTCLNLSSQELEDDVYQEISFKICKECKDNFVNLLKDRYS